MHRLPEHSPDSTLPENPWAGDDATLPYSRLEFGERWLLLSGEERDLIDRLATSCTRLDDPENTTNIFVGIQTSADHIYHLERIALGKYRCTPKAATGKKATPYEVEIEDAVMKPLVSGVDAKRYIEPETETYLLFPYHPVERGMKLIDAAVFAKKFPKAWAFLKSHEAELRKRESRKMDDDDQWWAYNYPKNLDKQEIAKLVVPRLVANLGCYADDAARYYLDNVDVGGVQPAEGVDLFYLSGIMNSPVSNFVFRHISKPFRGDYRSANKQFIAPLPVPSASPQQRKKVSDHARRLQMLHTQRRGILSNLARRMDTVQLRLRPDTWLFPTLATVQTLMESAPKALTAEEKRQWAEQRFSEALQAKHDGIKARFRPGVTLEASYADGELSFFVDGVPVINGIFLDAKDGAFVLAQWKVHAQTFEVTEKTDGKKLCATLRKLAVTDNQAAVTQIIALEKELTSTEAKIVCTERELNALVYVLYALTPKEILLVEGRS